MSKTDYYNETWLKECRAKLDRLEVEIKDTEKMLNALYLQRNYVQTQVDLYKRKVTGED